MALLLAQRARMDSVADRVAGEKIDSGLGGLPHFEQWKNHPGLAPLASRTEPAEGVPQRLAAGITR